MFALAAGLIGVALLGWAVGGTVSQRAGLRGAPTDWQTALRWIFAVLTTAVVTLIIVVLAYYVAAGVAVLTE